MICEASPLLGSPVDTWVYNHCLCLFLSFLLGKHKAAIEVYNEAARLNEKDWVSLALQQYEHTDITIMSLLIRLYYSVIAEILWLNPRVRQGATKVSFNCFHKTILLPTNKVSLGSHLGDASAGSIYMNGEISISPNRQVIFS